MVISLLLYLTWCFFNSTELISYKTDSFSLSAASSEMTRRLSLSEDKRIIQKISIDKSGFLNQIKIRMVDVPASLDGYLEVKLYDNNEKVLYDEKIDGDHILNGDFYVTSSFVDVKIDEVNIGVSENDVLFLEISVHEMPDTPSVIICERNNVDTLQIGDNNISNEFLILDYCIESSTTYYWVVAMIVLLDVLSIYALYRQNRFKKYFQCVLYLLMPLVIQLCSEWMNGTIDAIKFKYFLINLLLCYLLYILVQCVLKKRIGIIVYTIISGLLLVINYHLLQFRGQPLMVTDITQLGTALTVVGNYSFILTFQIATLLCLDVIVVIIFLDSKRAGSSACTFFSKRINYLFRFISSLAVVGILVGMCLQTEMNLSNWDIAASFNTLGWLYTNVKLTRCYLNLAPDGYNKDATEDFVEEVASNMQIAIEDAVTPVNLIVIMDESFSDLSILGDFETNEEVLPYLNSLEESEYLEKGYVGVHVLGGGTATSEWELLTGSNFSFMDIGSLTPYNLLKNNSSKYSYLNLCTSLRNDGYRTIAMHPYIGGNYSRDMVYELFGFDDFKNADNWYDDASFIRWCASDEYDFDKLIEQYENKTSDKLFVFNVTMQNHGGYTYPMDTYNIQESTLANDELNCYLSLSNYTDSALEKLINYFSDVDEPTMIVFFGDHQPALPDNFYEMVFGSNSITDEQEEKKYVTPYFIWSNYARETYDMSYINLDYLEAIVKAEAGIDLNTWDKYLLSRMEEYPVIGKCGIFDSDYNFYPYDELSEEQEELLEQMRYAQYYRWTVYDGSVN